MLNAAPLSERALERRLKRHLRKVPQQFLAVCTPGFEQGLKQELHRLPEATFSHSLPGGVEFSGPLDLIYYSNLRLRSANRVLWRIDDFLAQSYPMLFNQLSRLPWELYLGFAKSYNVVVSAKESRLRHHKRITETIHEAVLKALTPLGLKPKLASKADLEVYVRLFQDRCTLSLNSSGTHLHKRGYRQATAKAPLRETLAASILLSSRWQNYDLILDPMCGSGTLLSEAALLAKNRAPGLRRSFAFEQLPFFQETKWQRLKAAAAKEVLDKSPIKLVGIDNNQGALRAARTNAKRAGVDKDIDFQFGDAVSLSYPKGGTALLLSNLPYGQRIGHEAKVKRLYQDFVGQIKNECQGWDFALITAQPKWLTTAGLKPKKQQFFLNGGLRVALLSGTIV